MSRSQQADRERIAADIEAFLKRGGVIQKLEQHEISGRGLDDYSASGVRRDGAGPKKPDRALTPSWRD